MPSPTNQEPASRAIIRSTAFSLLMTHGIKRTSFTAIADACGQGRSLVHYYYPKKEQLVSEFFVRLFECINDEAANIPQLDDREANLARGGQIYFAFLLKDEAMHRFTVEALSDRNTTNEIIRLNGDWALPQIGHSVDYTSPLWRAHIISNGGVFELLHECLSSGASMPSSAELSAMSVSTYLALGADASWNSTFNRLMPRMLTNEETAPIVEAVSKRVLL